MCLCRILPGVAALLCKKFILIERDPNMKNRKRILIIVFVMITLIHSLITVSGSAEEASETATAAGSGELPSDASEGNTVISSPVIFADERQMTGVQ